MTTYRRPGTYVEEVTLAQNVANQSQETAYGAFVGQALRGPIDAPAFVSTWSDYVTRFGQFRSANGATTYRMAQAVYSFFANGGRGAWIQRLVGTGATSATVTFNDSGNQPVLQVDAANPGDWAVGQLFAQISSVNETGDGGVTSNGDTFTLSLFTGGANTGNIVESWTDLSLDPTSPRFALDVVNGASSWATLVRPSGATGSLPPVEGVPTPLAQPGDIDFVVVREGTEGLYCGAGGAVRRNTPQEVATEVSINTAYGVERVVRYAFKLAMKRKKHVTLVHKKNVLVNAGDMWQRIVDKVGEEYPEVTHDYQHIDAATIFLVSDPSRFDVILTDNLFGDILTDEAGSVVGGVGYSASGCINASDEFPSMFEPIHGSAPDIAGQNKANPTAAILSAAMLLEHLGFDDAAKKIHTAVEADIEELGSTVRSTDQVGKDILARM